MGDLSAHFSRAEFACHCCGEFQLDLGLLGALEALRNLAGVPIVVQSGYRCPKHNRDVGGQAHSQHVLGKAADIRLPGLGLQHMYELAVAVPALAEGGIGAYDRGFLHVDVRGRAARWAQVAGRYVAIHELVREPAPAETAAQIKR